MGRTKRKRNRKLPFHLQLECVNSEICYFRSLIKWSLNLGLVMKGISSTIFKETGRGIKTTKYISPESVVISVPRRLLISLDTLWESELNFFLRNCMKTSSLKAAFSFFLLIEKQKGAESNFYHYLNSLPKYFTTPSYITDKETGFVPEFIREERNKQMCQISSQLKKIKRYLAIDCSSNYFHASCRNWSPSFDDVRWAWNVINTRSVFFDPKFLKCNNNLYNIDFALAPVLDLLNHNDAVNIEATFNASTNMYEIKTLDAYKPGGQVFINYGPHCNRKLLCEYGFIIPDNVHTFIPINYSKIEDTFKNYCSKNQFHDNFMYLKTIGVNINQMGCTLTGLDWNFIVTAHVFLKSEHNSPTGHLPKTCSPDACIIKEFSKKVLDGMIEEAQLHVVKLKERNSPCLKMTENLLISEIRTLENVLLALSDECLL